MVVFKTKVLHFKIENTLIKDANGTGKFKRMLSFLFVDKRELSSTKLAFERFNLVFYTADRSALVVYLCDSTRNNRMKFRLYKNSLNSDAGP